MPRTLSPMLERCLERANPNVAQFVEISTPDQSRVLRKGVDDFLTTPPMVSVTPGGSAVATPNGALTLASVADTLVSQFAEAGGFNIPQEELSTYFNSVAWEIDPSFPGAILRTVRVRIKYLHGTHRPDLKLYIYRGVQQAMVQTRQEGTSQVKSEMIQVAFAPLLPEALVVSHASLVAAGAIDGAGFATVTFDLTPYRLAVYPLSGPPPGPGESGQRHELYFSLQTLQPGAGNYVEWRYDTTSPRQIAGVGHVRELSWTRQFPDDPNYTWQPYEPDRALTFALDTEEYVPSSVAIHTLALDALPDPSSLGRIVFNQGTPAGTTATLELSTAGVGGPWAAVTNGDPVVLHQLTYHTRLTLTASADQRRAPIASAVGLEFRARVDVSPESIVEHMAQDVEVPFLAASVGEGKVTVVRTGRRDYRDVGTELAVAGADTQLEADIYLGSRHPGMVRADWFHQARALVSNRQPSQTTEVFSLLSIAKKLKRKIPEQIESINTTHTVVAASPTQVQVTPALTGTSPSGNEYDGKKYYMRVQASTQLGIESGTTWQIEGSTDTDKLDFIGLFGTLAAGDVVEVHSFTYALPDIVWIDADFADIWWELLTVYLGIPPDRIGLADVGSSARAGLPPRVTDRAPGDVATQAKLKGTFKLNKQESGDALIDQVSFILGGATIEIAGQIVFRQIYPLTDAAGTITVPADPVAAIFDARDYAGLETPTGRERRISLLACQFGVDTTAVLPAPTANIVSVDVDAIATLGLQDVDGLGTASIPEDISRWVFNSADAGDLLALMLTKQVVTACSTGVRVWPWSTVDAHPELTVGDSVVLVTDQYTDYDPAKRRKLAGMKAYPLTLVAVSEGGRRFAGFLQGLAGVADVQNRGGFGTVFEQIATVPLGMRIERTAVVSGVITVRVYVADPSPTNTVPIHITWTAEGVDAVAPASITLTPPADAITPDLATTAYAEFTITESTTGAEQGRVSFTAERTGRLPITDGIDVSPSGTLPGPSLEVVPTPGPTNYSIAYTPSSGVLLSINGGLFRAAPASPIVFARPAAGATSAEYTFKLTQNGQTVTDAIIVPAIDKDTVTPDLQVGPGTTTNTTVLFTPTATNPAAGAAPTITISPVGCSASSGGGAVVYADGSTTTIASGTVVTVNRPAFATGAATQATVTFRASISGAGAESISRTILNQAKISFGPSLDVVATPGSSSYSIAYIAASGTVQLSINGGVYTTAPASPIVVTRPAAGATPLDYTFRLIVDGQTVTDSVSILPVDAVGTGGATPDLVVVPSAPTNTTTTFTVTASNPFGGAAPTITMKLTGTTAVGGYVAGTLYTIASGSAIVVNRPAFGTSGQASVEFAATIAGQGVERIQRTVLNQVQDTFGPSLVVTPTVSSGSYSIAYTFTGSLSLTINGTPSSLPGTNPFTVTRTSASIVYVFTCLKDGQTTSATVVVEPLGSALSITLSIDNCDASNAGATGPPYNRLVVNWSVTGMPSGVTYDVGYNNGPGNMDSQVGLSSSPATFNGVTFAATPGKGSVFVIAQYNGQSIASSIKNKIYTT
ncbi:MAG: hypothetical protein JWL95_1653 [Gemmatimonadetes bacterium]|nr:hypothetical protein [Gemmatimonadota bacterium]